MNKKFGVIRSGWRKKVVDLRGFPAVSWGGIGIPVLPEEACCGRGGADGSGWIAYRKLFLSAVIRDRKTLLHKYNRRTGGMPWGPYRKT